MPLKQSNVVLDLSTVTKVNTKTSKWQVIKDANKQISQGQTKLSDLINELQKSILGEENVQVEGENPQRNSPKSIKLFRQRLATIFQQRKFHYIIIFLVLFDLIVILIDLILGMFHNQQKSTDFSMSF